MSRSTENVYSRLREAIIVGEYLPNTHLGEVELSERYGVSRTPIREALKRLETEGLLRRQQRRHIVRGYTRAEIAHAYDARALIEGYAAAQAAKNATREDLERLRRLAQEYEEVVEEAIRVDNHHGHIEYVKLVMHRNSLFHAAIFHCSRNEHLALLVSKVMVLPVVFKSYSKFVTAQLRSSTRAHELLIEAITEGDMERARSAMTEHVYRGRDNVLRYLGDGDSSAEQAANPDVAPN